MTENIDYAELDKAVGEAMRTRSSSTPRSGATIRPHAVRRPSQGQFIDFAPRVSSSPVKRPAQTRSQARQTQTRPALAPQLAQARARATAQAKAQARAEINARARAEAKARAEARLRAEKARLSQSARPVQAPRLAQARPVASAAPTKPQPVAKTPEQATRPSETKKAPESPNANNYSLGVRSPFMVSSTKITKRPLGQNIPETNADSLKSTKNIYSQKSPSKSPKQRKHTVVESPKPISGWLRTIIVLLVIAAGAGLGYLAYLLVFANQF